MSGSFRKISCKSISALVVTVILVGAFAPAASAAETYKHFDGNDKIDIASTSALKLTHFVLETKLRIQDAPPERGYIVSKGASGSWNRIDQNYALFIDPDRKIGGGFRAADGSYHYVYSPSVSMDVWHVAKLIYDGAKLRLVVDGKSVASKTVSKNPDTSLSEVLRIGANAKVVNHFFVGDMDYVKVMNQDTWKVGYYDSFGGSSTSDSTSSSSTSTDCDSKPMNQLRGVAFMDPVLSRNEKGNTFNAPGDYVPESFQRLKSYGFNLIRVPYYWESYIYNPTQFLNQLDLVAKTAQANNICVVFDNHHWFTSSYWNTDIGKTGNPVGFPSFVVKSFPSKPTYYETAGPFWDALLGNTLSINGKKIWDVQWEFMSKVISKVDGYNSVAGYEILNEPHLWSKTQYDKLGNYNTYLAQKIRSVSDKKIFFDRETTKEFTRDPNLEYKIVPRNVNKLVYAPHLYSVPTDGSGGMKQVQNFVEWSKEWGLEILIGEFSAHTQSDMTAFLKVWKQYGFAWTYWKWSKATSTGNDHLGNVVYESDTVAKTEALKWLLSSYNTVY